MSHGNPRPSSEAGRGVAFLKLAEAERRRWEVLGEFAKCVLFWSGKEASGFERSVPEQVHFEIALVTALAGTRRGGTSAIYLRC